MCSFLRLTRASIWGFFYFNLIFFKFLFKPSTRTRNNRLAGAALVMVDIGFYLSTLFEYHPAICASVNFLLVHWPVHAQSGQGKVQFKNLKNIFNKFSDSRPPVLFQSAHVAFATRLAFNRRRLLPSRIRRFLVSRSVELVGGGDSWFGVHVVLLSHWRRFEWA